MCVIAKNKKAFSSSKLKTKFHSDSTSNIENLLFPEFIKNTDEKMFEQLVVELSDKYQSKSYKNSSREDLYNEKGWSDLEVLCLLMFYKNGWSIQIPNEKDYFPSFVFTYNMEYLEKEIANTISKAHQIIKPINLETILKLREEFTALDITYLLHYFVLNHKDYNR